MENNLEDILVDNIEEKTPSKPKLRLIIIAIASIVLLAVLGTLAYVLLKGEPKKNPEFNNAELEKIVPQEPQSDEFDKLIAEIKNRDSFNQPQNSTPTEVKPQAQTQETSKTEEKTPDPKPEKKPVVESKPKPATQTESKALKQDKPTSTTETKQDKKKKQEEKKVTQNKVEKKVEKKVPSASKAFESVQNNTAPKGFYLQVGVFGGKPQATFMSKLSSFQYKTETLQKGGKVLTRYLVGPYSNRNQAEAMIFNVMQTMNIKPIVVEIK